MKNKNKLELNGSIFGSVYVNEEKKYCIFNVKVDYNENKFYVIRCITEFGNEDIYNTIKGLKAKTEVELEGYASSSYDKNKKENKNYNTIKTCKVVS